MTVAEAVIRFLIGHRPDAYCDDCIAKELGKNRHQIQDITANLARTSGFNRGPGGCVNCDQPTKLAIRAN